MSTRAQQYRSKYQKTFTLSSGAVWTLRPIPPLVLLEHFSLLQGLPRTIEVDTSKLSDQDRLVLQEKLLPLLRVILPACSVDPKIADGKTDENTLDINEITIEDLMELLNHVFELSGLTAAAEEKRKKSQEQT